MITILPSILTNDEHEFIKRLHWFGNVASMLHVDVMDGKYVSSHSLSVAAIRDLLEKEQFKADIEMHLMVEEPEQYIDIIKTIPHIYAVVLHTKTSHDLPVALDIYKKHGIMTGLSIGLKEDIHAYNIGAEYFLVLAEEAPGYSGTPFDESALLQIKQLKVTYNKMIEVDGGVNEQTGVKCIQAGADQLIVNSRIFTSDDPIATYHLLEQL